MLETFQKLAANQFEAVFCMFNTCVDTCSEATWNARVGNYLFCQVAFHILFWADFYLGQDDEHSFRRQRFHRENEHFFAGYEEFEDRAPTSFYDQAMVKAYLEHCRNKASEAIATETDDSLSGPSGFERRAFSRAELHIYNIRHIQHHTAMLSLRLRLDANQAIPWVGSGWREVGRTA